MLMMTSGNSGGYLRPCLSPCRTVARLRRIRVCIDMFFSQIICGDNRSLLPRGRDVLFGKKAYIRATESGYIIHHQAQCISGNRRAIHRPVYRTRQNLDENETRSVSSTACVSITKVEIWYMNTNIPEKDKISINHRRRRVRRNAR